MADKEAGYVPTRDLESILKSVHEIKEASGMVEKLEFEAKKALYRLERSLASINARIASTTCFLNNPSPENMLHPTGVTIHVMHEGTSYAARVMFNFRQVANVIILRFDKPLVNNLKDIVVFFSPVTGKWTDIEGLYATHPKLFHQINYGLSNIMKTCTDMLKEKQENRCRLLIRPSSAINPHNYTNAQKLASDFSSNN